MNKLVLTLCLCLSLQACSGVDSGSKTDDPSIIGEQSKKEEEKNGLLAITQFMAVMAVLKTQVD